MVASAKSRKLNRSVNDPVISNSSVPHHNSDGRRQLFGLSQAIREKAFQSTSPRSEESKSPSGNQTKHVSSINPEKPHEQSLEDKFRSLFNSDTEEANNLLKLKNRPKETDSNVSRSHSANKFRDKISFFESNRDRMTTYEYTPKVEMSPQRRCTSAIPASMDVEWNKVPPGPQVMLNHQKQSKTHQNTYVNLPLNYTNENGYIPRPMSAVPHHQQNGQRIVENGYNASYRPVPAARKSLYLEKDAAQQNFNGLYLSQRPASFQVRTNQLSQENNLAQSAPVITATQSMSQLRMGQPNSRPLNQKLIYLPKNPTINGHHQQANLRQVHHSSGPVPTYNEVNGVRLRNHAKPNADYKQNVTRVSSSMAGKPTSRDHYPQQNFSFRRAVHRTLSSESEKIESDIKKPIISAMHLPQDGDKSSRKSEDRDSGAVVDPEASAFDFDSSPISEDEKDVSPINHSRVPQSPETPINDGSRACTPIIPLLTTDDEFTDIPDEEQTVVPTSNLHHDQLKRRVDVSLPHGNNHQVTASGGAELSTTESAIHETTVYRLEQKPKVGVGKPQRMTSSPRRNYYGRIPSGDERRQKKSKARHRRVHDDSDVTDCSSRRASYQPPLNRRDCTCTHSYKNPYCSCLALTKDKSELGDTSSVRSMTTASVCSSLLRRSGSKRHHHYRKYHSGSEKHSRELRSLNKRVSRMEAHMVTLARNLAQLSTELRQQNVTARDVEYLRQQMNELRSRLMLGEPAKTHKSNKLINMKSNNHPKKNKLEKFFGENPPLLSLFLKELGYEKFIKNFETESIGMMELTYLDEKRLQDIGIPLGPRLRIMKEAQKSSYV